MPPVEPDAPSAGPGPHLEACCSSERRSTGIVVLASSRTRWGSRGQGVEREPILSTTCRGERTATSASGVIPTPGARRATRTKTGRPTPRSSIRITPRLRQHPAIADPAPPSRTTSSAPRARSSAVPLTPSSCMVLSISSRSIRIRRATPSSPPAASP